MARGGGGKGRRTYVRDNRGRFASGGGGGGGGGGRPKARMASRGTNRLTRDNAGRITSVGGTGATARGGRLKTASGKARGKVLAKGPVRLAGPGMIRKSDVRTAGIQNAISKNIERSQKAGQRGRNAEGTPSPIENAQKRLERAQARIAGQKRKPAAPSKPRKAAASKTANSGTSKRSKNTSKAAQLAKLERVKQRLSRLPAAKFSGDILPTRQMNSGNIRSRATAYLEGLGGSQKQASGAPRSRASWEAQIAAALSNPAAMRAAGKRQRSVIPRVRKGKTNRQVVDQANRGISTAYRLMSKALRQNKNNPAEASRLRSVYQRRLNRIAAAANRRGQLRNKTGIEGFDNPNYWHPSWRPGRP